MAAPKLSAQDKKDMDKFAKYLVYKCIQIIVQSRLGDKVRTQSKPFSSGSDWFNLAIKDIPEVTAETKRVFNTGKLGVGQYVCVEISLKTAEGETMILETWWLTMTDTLDPNARISYTVYNRMGVLLKSLFCISRVTPAYRLSRRQGPETFVICYRIYLGEPHTNHLGDGYEKSKVGAVPTPVGTVTLSVAYRTKMLISPHQSTKDLSVDLKDDHFNSESSPRRPHTSPKPCHISRKERRNLYTTDEGLMVGEPAENCATTFSTSPQDAYAYANGGFPPHSSPPVRNKHRRPSGDSCKDGEQNTVNGVTRKDNRLSKGHRLGAFAPHRDVELHAAQSQEEEDVPFGTLLLPPSVDNNANKANIMNGNADEDLQEEVWDDGASGSTTSGSAGNRSTHSVTSGSGPEDFVMVELKTPFAGPEGNSDLGRFYRDCQGAPPLSLFQESVTVQDTLNSITDQLALFEANSKDFDEFLDTLQEAAEG